MGLYIGVFCAIMSEKKYPLRKGRYLILATVSVFKQTKIPLIFINGIFAF